MDTTDTHGHLVSFSVTKKFVSFTYYGATMP